MRTVSPKEEKMEKGDLIVVKRDDGEYEVGRFWEMGFLVTTEKLYNRAIESGQDPVTRIICSKNVHKAKQVLND